MYAIVDIETTGGSPANGGITEIAILVFDGNRVTKKFTTLINPEQHIPIYITGLTGIDNKMVAEAPTFEDIAEDIFKLLQGNIFVAHNVNFDFSFVDSNLKKHGYILDSKKLCTVRLARKVFKAEPSYSLGNLCRSLGIKVNNRHRAEGDAQATVTLFEKILQNGGIEHIDKMLKRNTGEQWLPMQIEKEVIDNLPSKPGVYYFLDSKQKVIYVGKAVNIKKRVASHFTHTDFSSRRQHFLRLIANIKFEECVNELHALILESTEIKRLWPLYNRSQKQPQQRYGLYSYEDAKGYKRLMIDKYKKNVPAHYRFNLMHEGQVLLRNMVEEFELHDKLCFLNKEPIDTTDWEYLEAYNKYNKKVNNALNSLQTALPTFAVVEDGLQPYEKFCLLIEKGIFYGMGFIASVKLKNLQLNMLKEALNPFADNDFIRTSIYNYVELHAEKRIDL
jgi:DNA polymerase III subunit epsilon